MIQLSLSAAAKLTGAPLPSETLSFTGISIDTRTLTPGNLFVAIKGERVDGHDLLMEAQSRGAVAALVNYPVNASLPQLIVSDTVTALGDLAAFWRQSFSGPLVAVTGSNGKTTVKNMIAAIFQAALPDQPNAVLATPGNLNNTLGLPLTLATLSPEHHYAVLEMGMNQFGEIARLTDIARPTVAVITNAASSHLAGVGDVAGVAKAKGEIFSGLTKKGTAVLNADDTHFAYWKNLARHHTQMTFGLERPADVTAIYTGRPEVACQTPFGVIPLMLPLAGRHNLMNALAAIAAALGAGITPLAIQKGLATVQTAKGRLEHHQLANGAHLIDDTYNANPFSLNAAIAVLATHPGEKILILGDMKELGPEEIDQHALAGESIANAGIDRLMTYGTLSAHTSRAFGTAAKHFTSQAELLYALRPLLRTDTTVLIKGSHSMEMDKIVAELLTEPALPSR